MSDCIGLDAKYHRPQKRRRVYQDAEYASFNRFRGETFAEESDDDDCPREGQVTTAWIERLPTTRARVGTRYHRGATIHGMLEPVHPHVPGLLSSSQQEECDLDDERQVQFDESYEQWLIPRQLDWQDERKNAKVIRRSPEQR